MRFLYTLAFLFLTLSSFAQVSPTSLSYSSPSAGTQTFNFTCNPAAQWSVSTPTWIIINNGGVRTGTGPATITVNVDDNESFDQSRSDDILIMFTLGSNAPEFKYITITQAPSTPTTPTPTLILSTDLINVSNGATAFTFTSDESWTATMDSWLGLTLATSVEITSGSAGATNLNVVADPNLTTSPRIGTITFTSGSTSKNLTIIQDAASTPTLSLSTPSINVSNGATAFTFTSDDSWTAIMDSWLGLTLATSGNLRITAGDITSGSAGTTNLNVVPDPNPTSNSRTGTITFTSGSGSVSKTLTVTQAGATTTSIFGGASTQANDFIVYPNPSDGIIGINCPNGVTIYIYDTNGNILQSFDADVKNTTELNPGLYFIIAEDKNGMRTSQKLVVK